ncbi:winged helix-turn-helix transcriptional regulator [Pseudomonas sp. USHLN015]|uniref:winged helix-turn-helix transcriptional regulator n=1 Tax=Pseudomonas sp. USHLN015 TaxID=3081296 RepID=UPI00301B88C1
MNHDATVEHCPVARALELVGDRWSLMIVRDLFDGLQRFGELQKSLGVAKNILSDRLRRLVAEGILCIEPAADGSAYQAYALTAKGRDLFTLIVSLRQWGEAHCFAPGEVHSELLDPAGQPLARLEVRDANGRPVSAADTRVHKVEVAAG